MKQKVGRFITFEGIEGAGKSTQLAWFVEWLRTEGIPVLTTREPGGTALGEQLRALLLNPALPPMHPDTELLLLFTARNEHLQQVILPALQQGTWVVCDRFTDATYAYQGYGRGLSLSRIAQLEAWVQGILRPDITFLFDLAVETGMQRVERRGKTDRFEQEHREFFERIRAGYLARAAELPKQYYLIDAAQSVEDVQNQLRDYLHLMLRN